MSMITPTDKLIRKLRKKLRQIERLELHGLSSLNKEEILKVRQKNATRTELAKLLEQADCVSIEHKSSVEIAKSDTVIPSPDLKTETQFIKKSEKISENETKEILPTQSSSEISVEKKNSPVKTPKETFPNSVWAETASSEIMMKRRLSTEETLLSPEPPSTSTLKKKVKPENKSSLCEKELPKCKSGMTSASKESSAQILKESPAIKGWHETPFVFNILEAHNDIVTCVDFDEEFVVSGSRDTLVQVWCAKTGSSVNNLRGHTNTVTCTSLLSTEASKILNSVLSGTISEETGPRLLISGSSDCCLKLWSVDKGSALRSIYTFSGVTALCYLSAQQYCVVGSEGGKLEIYTFAEENTNPIFSFKAFEGPVSSIKLQGDNLVCSSLDGFISVWSLKGTELCRLYQSEDLFSESGGIIYLRPIISLAVSQNEPSVFYGDEGVNVKKLIWKTGLVKKIRNHSHDFGITNAISVTKSFLLASSFDLDTGNSSVNIRSLPDLDYLGTLNIPCGGRIVCLAAIENQNDKALRIVVGGTTLILLETRGIGCRRSPKMDSVMKPQFVNSLNLPAIESAGESSSSEDELDEENDDQISNSDETVHEGLGSAQASSWCLIL